jgi:hypothetical protein
LLITSSWSITICRWEILLGFGVFSFLLGECFLFGLYFVEPGFRVTFWKILVCRNVC